MIAEAGTESEAYFGTDALGFAPGAGAVYLPVCPAIAAAGEIAGAGAGAGVAAAGAGAGAGAAAGAAAGVAAGAVAGLAGVT